MELLSALGRGYRLLPAGLSKCHPHVTGDRLWGPKTTYGAKSGRPLKGLLDIRGLDETANGWTVYVIDVEPAVPLRFRWSDDMGRTWKPMAPITHDWQPLRGGLEIRFGKFAWEEGYSASFSIRDQLLSQIGPKSRPRHCVEVAGAADTIISDNQMYVRGSCDPQVTAIRLREPAINLLVHDNLIRNCGVGLAADTGQARVAEVIDATTFVCGVGHVPMERRRSHCYRGYRLVWSSGGKLRGPAADAKTAVSLRGRFQILDNQFFGFAEPTAVLPLPDRLGKTLSNVVRGNVFQGNRSCTK